MKESIDFFHNYLKNHPKFKQWIWFFILWLMGLFSVLTLAYPIKILIKTMN